MGGDKWPALEVIFVPLGLIVCLYITYRFITRNNDYFAKRNVPYIKPTLVFGNTLRVFMRKVSLHDSVIELYSQLDGHKIGGVFQLMQPVYLVRDPELIKHVTVKDFEHFVDLPIFIPEDIEPILTKSLQALKGKWTTQLLLLYGIILNLILSIDLHDITLIFSNPTFVKLGRLRGLAKHSCIGDTFPCTSCPTDCTPRLTILHCTSSDTALYCQRTRIRIPGLPSNCTTLAQHSPPLPFPPPTVVYIGVKVKTKESCFAYQT